MFSDTHFHFENLCSKGLSGSEILSKMAENNCFFGLDIGTDSDDLISRIEFAKSEINKISDKNIQNKIYNFLYFSSGIWPRPDEIKNRISNFKTFTDNINLAEKIQPENKKLHTKIIALGECGLDHHWNPQNVDKRDINDFNGEMLYGEKELFEMQLDYAKSKNLPVIIHSRDAFEETLESIKNVNYHNGIIHCYSYGQKEAEQFLSLGWYISLSGSVTYTKKSKMEQMENLILSIPVDKLLVETDAPYLAPNPFRGQTNSPVLINNTYEFIAKIRNISTEELCSTVDKNIVSLFKI